MAKYSFELKQKVVQAYLSGEGGYKYLAKKYSIVNEVMVRKWVNAYQKMGSDGLMRSRKNKTYSFDFKLHMVESYLTTEVSYQELALSVGMNNPTLLARWVNDFRIAGPDALKLKTKERRSKVEKPKDISKPIAEKINSDSKYLKQLEEENLKLRIENAYLKEVRRLRRGKTSKQKARIIQSLRGSFKLKDILAITGFPKATYMYWQKRFERENPDLELETLILEIHKQHKDFGYRRICGQLRKNKVVVNKKKVQRIVQKLGIQVTSFTRKSRKYSSYKGRIGKVAPNRLHRRFNTNVVHQKITTDTSEFKYYEIDDKGRMIIKKLYLDPFMDLCNREIISHGISQSPSAENIMKALNEAIDITSDCQYRRTFHSDQGWAYQMKAYSHTLKANRIYQSMSRKGNCYDNSVMENFFAIMKQEMYYGVVYHSYNELKSAIEKYIKYYNEQRIKQNLGWMSPVEYRLSLLAA
ncbi:IS3 family transposase [Anaerosinus massiliensis]|uniref:IS3 family transposase n=1 Tax=Massilibacillus massiliensis TaxID=1806837 RepID=UPI001F2E914D|nr:IS3 family transposase [Massilibacillus massiliensis]